MDEPFPISGTALWIEVLQFIRLLRELIGELPQFLRSPKVEAVGDALGQRAAKVRKPTVISRSQHSSLRYILPPNCCFARAQAIMRENAARLFQLPAGTESWRMRAEASN